MDKRTITTLLFAGIFATCFSQQHSKVDSTLFFKGIYFENINYLFPWSVDVKEINDGRFKNLEIKKQKMSVWSNIKFDSVTILNGITVDKVIIKVTKNKNDSKSEIQEFVGFVNLENFKRLTDYFDYKGRGWKTFRNGITYCRLALSQHKKNNYVIIDRIIHE